MCLQLFTCYYVVCVWRGFLFVWVLGMDYVILLWHSLSLPYNQFDKCVIRRTAQTMYEEMKVLPTLSYNKGDADKKLNFPAVCQPSAKF